MTAEEIIAILEAEAMAAQATQTEQPSQERGFGAALYDNIIGNPDDGVQSYGEQLGTWLNRGGETMSLGTVGDETSAAMTGLLPGRTYEGELDRYRENEDNMSTMGRLSADLAGSVVPALLGVGAVGRMASGIGGRIASGAGLGAGAGAVQGFMEGEDGLSNRLVSGGIGAGVGGVLGGAMPVLAEAGRSGVRAIRDGVRNSRIGKQIGGNLGVSPEAGRVVSALIGSDDQAAMAESLRRAGPDAMLADASPAMSGVLDSAMRTPVPGARTAQDRIAARAGASYDNVVDAIAPQQGPQQSVRGVMEGIRKGSAPARKSAYEAAYSKPIDYSGAAGSRLLDDISPRLPQEAVSYANRLMRLGGEKSKQIMAEVADDGTVTFTNPPDVRQWDYIKQALDQMAESGDGAGALGGQTRMGSAYQSLARDVRDSVAEAVPEYKTALSTASDAISQRNSVQFGADMLNPKITTDEAIERIASATGPEVAAMKEGVRGQLQEVIGNVKAVASDQNIDARQALDAYKRLSSPNSQRKMEALFGDDWDAISQALDQAGAALGLRARTAANSATAGRQFANELVEGVTEPGALRQGKPLDAAKGLIGGITGASPEAVRALRDRTKSELADVLTRQGGMPAKTVDEVVRVLMNNPMVMDAGSNTALGLGLAGTGAVPIATGSVADLLAR